MATNIIKLLPDAIANQIAAGEVVQRPASVVKELLENSVDANASNIKVSIKEAGKTLIQVIDDGKGMSETDARMCLEKHATSKISKTEDLFHIHTMGFRGEAIASIAAVSQLEIETRMSTCELGTRILVEASCVKSQEPIATGVGTTMTVKNLFFNVPARRNFLKSTAVETKHIIETFQQIALAHPTIAFSLYQNNQETCHLPVSKLSHRIVHLLGEGYKKQLIPCQETTDIVHIHGYVGNPMYAKKTRGEQFFFVNQRFIKNAYLHHAVKQAFDSLILPDSFPFYVLFIDIDPKKIDVNVHPTKTEIKFEDEKAIYSILQATVKQALAQHSTPLLDFEQNMNQDILGLQSAAGSMAKATQHALSPKDREYASFKNLQHPMARSEVWEQLFQSSAMKDGQADETLSGTVPTMPEEACSNVQDGGGSTATTNSTQLASKDEVEINLPSSVLDMVHTQGAATMQLHGTYILASVKSGLLLVDQHAAHERILYEKYLADLQNNSGASQQMLFPHQINFNPSDFELITEYQGLLNTLGFSLEEFGKNSMIIVGCPVEASHHDPEALLENVLEQIKWNQSHLKIPTHENIARSLAKHASIAAGKALNSIEIDNLIDQLFACKNANYSPAGKRIWTIINLEKIADLLAS